MGDPVVAGGVTCWPRRIRGPLRLITQVPTCVALCESGATFVQEECGRRAAHLKSHVLAFRACISRAASSLSSRVGSTGGWSVDRGRMEWHEPRAARGPCPSARHACVAAGAARYRTGWTDAVQAHAQFCERQLRADRSCTSCHSPTHGRATPETVIASGTRYQATEPLLSFAEAVQQRLSTPRYQRSKEAARES